MRTYDHGTAKDGGKEYKESEEKRELTKSDFIKRNFKYPFAGCSAAFTTTIKNCTIENCVSYATVYGKKYVGGILGTRDNAMGGCSVTSCKFYGNVEGSDELVGGIAGGGYEVDGNATALDVISKVLTDNEYTWDNAVGNYISAITKADGTKLEQKDNGANSGWMYTLNGIHPDLAVNEQYLEDGDVIVFHYTDDYSKEHDHIWSSEWTSDADAHWHECTYQWSKCDITENAKKKGTVKITVKSGKKSYVVKVK